MGRWGSELWPDFTPELPVRPPDDVYLATYTALVDVDLVRSEIRFNEALHPDEILAALLEDNWGSLSLASWPPAGCTERNRFLVMALRKIEIFLEMAEYVQQQGKPARQRVPKQQEPPEAPRTWAYKRFPGALAAREAGGGPYRGCSLVARVRAQSGFVIHDYCMHDDGAVVRGLATDLEMMAFVRALVQTDLRLRLRKLLGEG